MSTNSDYEEHESERKSERESERKSESDSSDEDSEEETFYDAEVCEFEEMWEAEKIYAGETKEVQTVEEEQLDDLFKDLSI